MVIQTWSYRRFYRWYDNNKSRDRYFTRTNNVEYTYLDSNLEVHQHIATYLFNYIELIYNSYRRLLPDATMYLVVKDNSILFVTPRTTLDFIWGDHYNFFKDGNQIPLHYTRYVNQEEQPRYTRYLFHDRHPFELDNERIITQESFENLPVNNNSTMVIEMRPARKRDMIREIMSVIFNDRFIMTASSDSANATNSSAGGGRPRKKVKPDIGTFSVYNDRTKSYNTTVMLEFNLEPYAGFGISSQKKLTKSQIIAYTDKYLQKGRKTVEIYHV